MKSIRKILPLLFFLISTEASAHSINYTLMLDFGKLVPTAPSGSMEMSTSGNASRPSGVQIYQSGHQGMFDYSASLIGSIVSIFMNIIVTTTTVTLTSDYPGAPPVTIDNFAIDPDSFTLTLLVWKINDIKVGGKLSFSSTPRGTYTGTVGVQVTSLLGQLNPTNGTVPVKVVFMDVLTINERSPLNFGTLELRPASSGIVRITPTGNRSIVSGTGINLSNNGATPSPGSFAITGEPNQSINVSVPTSITLSGDRGGDLEISNITTSPTGSFLLNSSGDLTLMVGGDLAVNPGQLSGTYRGTYTVTVNY